MSLRHRMTLGIVVNCLAWGWGVTETSAEDWLQFRGTDNSGIVRGAPLPDSLDQTAWTAALTGRGLSSPLIVGDRLYVTCSDGFRQDRLIVACYGVEDGARQWQREFWATGRTICHEKMCVATPTPASDGEHIYAFYSSNDVICLDLDGNLQWYRGLTFDFPNVSNSLGMSSSLAVRDGTLICMAENDTQSVTFGLNTADGSTRWQKERPRSANWTSPVVWPGDDSLVLLQSSKGLTAVEARSGKAVWEYQDGASTIPSLVVDGGIAYVPSHGLTALKPGSSDPQTPEILWQVAQLSPSTASPLVHAGRAYVINNAGVLVCADAESGERLWQCRLSGKFSATPLISTDRLYCFNEQGLGQVVKLGDKQGEVIHTRDFEETLLATPSAARGALYVRSDKHLWKIE